MPTTITAVSTEATTSPELVLGYQTSRESRNIVHDLISGRIAVTMVGPRPRAGVLELFYLTENDAFDAMNLHATESMFTLYDSDRPAVNMTYVIDGSVELELDDETRDRWVVSVGYQEVEL